ncbi:MAG: hypothetical protein KF901_09420 [Myxococcales bacterium]|nr:hypothetical protein [Myxococcales bacterium]
MSRPIRSRATGTVDPRTADVCTADVCTAAARTTDARTTDVCTAAARTTDVRTTDVRTTDVCTADVCTAAARTADIRTADVRTTDTRPADSRTMRNHHTFESPRGAASHETAPGARPARRLGRPATLGPSRGLVTRAALLLGVLSLLGDTASAQVAGRRPVQAGDVTGVELQIEGSLSVARGDTLRLALVAYEVVGLDRLRPAPGAEVRVATSLTRRRGEDGDGVLSLTTDARGRALLELPVPSDAPGSFGATIELRARRGVSRRFELRVTTLEPRTLSLFGAEAATSPGELPVFGRYASGAEGLSGQEIRLTLHDARGPLGAPVVARTDGRGVYAHAFRVPRDAQAPLRVDALSPGDESTRERAPGEARRVRASWTASVSASSEPPLLVQVQPSKHLALPGERVRIDVVVRRADGRPVPETRLRLGGGPIPLDERLDDPRERFTITDARGRASLEWQAPRIGGEYGDTTMIVQAGRAGVGTGAGAATVRVSGRLYASRLSIEGAALVPGLGARVFVRVTTMDGAPAPANVPVSLEGPRVGRASGVTSEGGVAALDVRVGPVKEGDRCGGESATDVVVSVQGETAEGRCLPVDADASLRVRAAQALVAPGAELAVEIDRAPGAAGMPVTVTLFARAPALRPLATQVVDGRETRARFTLDAGTHGELLVRARPLVGPQGLEVRGGFASAFAGVPVADFGLAAEGARDAVVARLRGGLAATSLAVPLGEDTTLRAHLEAAAAGPFADLRGAPRNDTTLAAVLAERTPTDVAAPAVLRGRSAEPAPEPASPEAHGLLRDPWRTSARFVEGRLALLFRAIEQRIDAAVPDQLDEVAIERGGRFSFNRQLLASLPTSSLGGEGATGLGGEPLTIERLEALDRSFSWDTVARRITRERLFKLLLALRQFVQQGALDLPWTRPGDPTLWVEQLRGRYVDGAGSIRPGLLVDGWGRPFRLVRTARARFGQVQPVAGYELVSAGPDGRFGNADDVYDPTARVLPTGSLYGAAVGEDALVARLRGVELGRATLGLAAGVFGAPHAHIAPPPDQTPTSALGSLPPRQEPDLHALALRRPTRPTSAVIGRGEGELRLAVGSEPRSWRVVALAVDAAGNLAVASDAARAGAPVLADLVLPSRLRTDEPLRFPLHLSNVSERDTSARLELTSEGVALALDASTVPIPAGESRSFEVEMRATSPGEHVVRVVVHGGEPAGELQRIEGRVAVDGGGHPIRRRAAGLAGTWSTRFDVPRGARGVQSRLVLVAPNALAADPDLADVRRDDPALVAWAETLAGRALDPALRARLLRAQRPDGSFEGREAKLSSAAAIVALAALVGDDGEPDPVAAAARERAVARLNNLPPFEDRDGQAGRVRMLAAVTAALATSGAAHEAGEVHDPIAELLRAALPELRRALIERPGEPTLLARAAGALLLADPRDGHARAMLAKARDAIADDGLVGGGERTGLSERLAASLALALGAKAIGDDALAERLVRQVAPHAPVVARRGGEEAFWWLAAGAYGALGGAPERVRVDGREITLERGTATLDLGLSAGASRRVEVVSSGGAVLARAEAVFAAPFDAREDGPLGLALAGEVGRVGELAALELSVRARARVNAPTLDLQLPAGVEPDERLLAALRSNGMVRSVERREPGFLRIVMAPMEPQQEATLPLPLRWRAAGSVRGLGVVAYEAAQPEAMSALAPRPMVVR